MSAAQQRPDDCPHGGAASTRLSRAKWRRIGISASRFRADRIGATAVEFGLVAMPFFAIIAAIFEVGYCNFENEMLANAVNTAARAMMTGSMQAANVSTAQQFVSSYLCPTSGRTLPSNFNCANLIIDVRSTTTFAAGDTANDFYKSSTNQFCPGQPGQIMVLRVAYPLGAIFPANLFSPSAGVVSDVPNLAGRYHILMASALFQEENYSGSYASPSGC